MFNAYQDGCIALASDGSPAGDGTFLTRNAYALAFNYASHEVSDVRHLDPHLSVLIAAAAARVLASSAPAVR